MGNVGVVAQPWCVNLLLFVPFIAYLAWRRAGLNLTWSRLAVLAVFAISFGFVEASVVIYLHAAAGQLGYGAQVDLTRWSVTISAASMLPESLMRVEVIREVATMLVLISVALLTSRTARERWAAFLWCFAVWDLTYYAGLRATLGWPSLQSPDILFLIPVPWVARVWFPVLVSTLAVLAVLLAKTPRDHSFPVATPCQSKRDRASLIATE